MFIHVFACLLSPLAAGPYGSASDLTQALLRPQAEFSLQAAKTQESGAYLGVELNPDQDQGVQISRVIAGSPAERAGLAAGDQILACDDQPLHSVDQLVGAVQAKAPGDTLILDIQRDEKSMTLLARLAPRSGADGQGAPLAPAAPKRPGESPAWAPWPERIGPLPFVEPTEPGQAFGSDKEGRLKPIAPQWNAAQGAGQAFLGVTLNEDVEESSDSSGPVSTQRRVTIALVTPGSPAEAAGLKPGDQILGIDGQPIRSSQDVVERVRAHQPGETLGLEYSRGGKAQQVEATLGTRGDGAAPEGMLNLDRNGEFLDLFFEAAQAPGEEGQGTWRARDFDDSVQDAFEGSNEDWEVSMEAWGENFANQMDAWEEEFDSWMEQFQSDLEQDLDRLSQAMEDSAVIERFKAQDMSAPQLKGHTEGLREHARAQLNKRLESRARRGGQGEVEAQELESASSDHTLLLQRLEDMQRQLDELRAKNDELLRQLEQRER